MEKTNSGLLVGYARASITPGDGMNMRGYGNHNHRLSTGALDTLCATCLAFRDGDTTILLYSTDLLCADVTWTQEARAMLNAELGIPAENIQIGATHSHTAPAVGIDYLPAVAEWKVMYMDALLSTAKEAIADLAPATMYGKKVMTEGQNYVRHYLMEDGTYAGSNFGDWKLAIKGHATDGDREMTLVKFAREGDKKDILLMNWQAHADMIGGTMLSADYVGAARAKVEEETGLHFVFFLGATGDQNPNSRIKEEKQNNNYKVYGEELAQIAIDTLPAITEKIEGQGIASKQETITYRSNKYGQDRLEDAKKATEHFRATGNVRESNAIATAHGFFSVFQCNGIVSCSDYPEDGQFTVNVHRIGGLGFVAAPFEMFSKSGLYIKQNSPYPFTIVSTVTNGYGNYFPSKEAFIYGCYESYTARFDIGIGEDTAVKYVELLKEIQ